MAQRSEGLVAALFLYHRIDWPGGGYRVCMPMQNLPGALFRSKDHRNPQSEWDDILSSAKSAPVPLYPHNVGKLRSYILRYGLEAIDFAISNLRCGTLRSRSDLLPPTRGRGNGVSEGYVFLMGEHHLHGLGVPFDELA